MEVTNSNLWLQLGVAGATLFIIFMFGMVFLNKVFNLLGRKIDNLAEAFNKVAEEIKKAAINTMRDQKETNSQLKMHTEILLDMQQKITRIDDRTSLCLVNREGDDRDV